MSNGITDSNFHVRDLIDYIKCCQDLHLRHNILDIEVPVRGNERIIRKLNYYYPPIKAADKFVIFQGYNESHQPVINFYKIYDDSIVLKMRIWDSSKEVSLLHFDMKTSFMMIMKDTDTLKHMFREIKKEYRSSSYSIIDIENYEKQIDDLEKFITRIVKIYVRYIKTGKIRMETQQWAE